MRVKVALAGCALVTGAGRPGRDPGAWPARAAPRSRCCGEDLAERAMLGDAGANALGAMLGAAAAASLPRPARVALLAGIIGLTAASEVVSFTAVIERTPALRWLDMLGRRPAEGAGRPAGDPRAGPVPGSPAVNGRRPPVTRKVQGAGPTSGAASP